MSDTNSTTVVVVLLLQDDERIQLSAIIMALAPALTGEFKGAQSSIVRSSARFQRNVHSYVLLR